MNSGINFETIRRSFLGAETPHSMKEGCASIGTRPKEIF